MPSAIEQVQREFGDAGLAVVAINIADGKAEVAAWVAARRLTSIFLVDEEGEARRAYRVVYTPTVFLVGRDGRLVARAVGSKAWTGDQGRALLRRLVRYPP